MEDDYIITIGEILEKAENRAEILRGIQREIAALRVRAKREHDALVAIVEAADAYQQPIYSDLLRAIERGREALRGDPGTADNDAGTEIRFLAKLLKDKFPAEAARADFSDHTNVFGVARELLDRLWRWEN